MDQGAEHLKVAVRVRPSLSGELRREEVLEYAEEQGLTVADGEHLLSFRFDRVFQPGTPQEEVFDFVRPAVEATTKGYNCTLFAYGQTGSGKTYTMFGADWEAINPAPQVYHLPAAPNNPVTSLYSDGADPLRQMRGIGIIPQTVMVLFQMMREKQYTAYCSFLQIYNEKIYDLLQDPARAKALNIREEREVGIYVEQLAEFVVETEEDCFDLIRRGDRHRVVRQTKYNNHSSRSHTIFQLLLESDHPNKHGLLKRAKINLCDLAGSEKYDKEGRMVAGHVRELACINQSLTVLGKVIAALGASGPHIPYRDSKLTRLLQDSLGLNTRTILIATVGPSRTCIEETISTLKFADRAREVMVKVKKNEISATSDKMVSRLQREIGYLKSLLDIRRRGGMEQIHHELTSLKEENHKLRSLTSGLSLSEVEKLRLENKQLRLQLQKVQNASLDNTSSPFFMTEAHSKPASAAGEITDLPVSIPSSSHGVQPLAQEVYEMMGKKGTDIQATLDALRKRDLQVAAENLKRKIRGEGRCPVCTLKIPCKHYQDVTELPQAEEQENADPRTILNISNMSDRPALPDLPNRGRQSSQPSQRIPHPPRSHHSGEKPLSYRLRGTTHAPRVTPAHLIEVQRSEERKSALKDAERKLQTLEKLEKYREEKLRREIERLEEERQAEEAQVRAEQAREERKAQYYKMQKEKLIAFDLQRFKAQSEARELATTEVEKKGSEEKKVQKQRQKQKLEIENYHHKKRILDGILSNQVQDLGNPYTEEQVLAKDHDSLQALRQNS
jgi:hypothetical protein